MTDEHFEDKVRWSSHLKKKQKTTFYFISIYKIFSNVNNLKIIKEHRENIRR